MNKNANKKFWIKLQSMGSVRSSKVIGAILVAEDEVWNVVAN